MNKSLSLCLLFFAISSCSEEMVSDPRQNPTPRNAAYYRENPQATDAQRLICAEIPSQARSTVLEGNCVAADSAYRRR